MRGTPSVRLWLLLRSYGDSPCVCECLGFLLPLCFQATSRGVTSHVFLPDWFHGIRYTTIPLCFHTHFGNASILWKVAVGRKAVSVQFCFVDLNSWSFPYALAPSFEKTCSFRKTNTSTVSILSFRKAPGTYLVLPQELWS